jgi:phage terminase small subunit
MPKQQELDDFALTARQALFIAEYLKDFNATQAAIRAGYSKRSARCRLSTTDKYRHCADC